jgi:zinc protease
VTPEEVYLLADQYLSSLERQHPPPAITTVEPEQPGERRLLIETDAQTPLLHVAFHAGATGDPETLHADLLLAILAEGDSSRLHRALVEEEQLALSVGAFQTDGFDPGLAYFYLTLPPGGDLAQTEARLLEELGRVAAGGVTEAELEKARNLRLASFWRELQTISGKAHALGNFEVFTDDYENLFALPERLAESDAAALQAVARKIFVTTNMTVGVLRAPAEGASR